MKFEDKILTRLNKVILNLTNNRIRFRCVKQKCDSFGFDKEEFVDQHVYELVLDRSHDCHEPFIIENWPDLSYFLFGNNNIFDALNRINKISIYCKNTIPKELCNMQCSSLEELAVKLDLLDKTL